MKEDNILVLNRKKNDQNAKNAYHYKQIEQAEFYFVPCTLEETYDELVCSYDLTSLTPFLEVKQMQLADQYSALLQVMEAFQACPQYQFSLHPENLFFDAQKRVRVLERDISGSDRLGETRQLQEIQALAGYVLQSRYRYENLREGGLSLLKKSSKTKYLLELETLEQAREVFAAKQKEAAVWNQQHLIQVNKHGYYRSLWIMGAAVIGCITMGGMLFYQNKQVFGLQQAALQAQRSYMEQDFPGVVDALAGVSLEQMDPHEKYLLASVLIRGQSVDSFNSQTKERLLAKLSYNGEEQLLDYWISLGRMDLERALDIAMKMSDHQLTLYAYLQKMDQVSADSSLSGAEKVEQISTLKDKVKSLADELGIEYQEQ